MKVIEIKWKYLIYITIFFEIIAVKLPEPEPEVIENMNSEDLIAQRRSEFIAKQAGGKKMKLSSEKT